MSPLWNRIADTLIPSRYTGFSGALSTACETQAVSAVWQAPSKRKQRAGIHALFPASLGSLLLASGVSVNDDKSTYQETCSKC